MNLESIRFELGNADINLESLASPPSADIALVNNQPFPDDAFVDGAIPLGAIKISASRDIILNGIRFSGAASNFAGFGVYRSNLNLLSALKIDNLDELIIKQLDFPDEDTRNLFVLRWGYELGAAASGKIAFAPGVSFGVDGRREGFFSVIRSFDRNANALDALKSTVNSWRAPRQINSLDDIKPGTWLIAEAEGALKLSLGVEYGCKFDWIRESLKPGELNGDFGLKIEMGVKTTLGFEASGRYALVIARESEAKKLRLQIFRLKKRGWSFSFDSGLAAQIEQEPVPDNFDDFIKSVFNIQGLQVLHDIGREFDKWSNPANNLRDLLGETLINQAKDLAQFATGLEPNAQIDAVIAKLRRLIGIWRALPHETASLIYSLVRQDVPLESLRAFLERIRDLSDPDLKLWQDLANAVADELRAVNFYNLPVGKWLSALANENILDLLDKIEAGNLNAIKTLHQAANNTLALLDSGETEQSFRRLQEWIEDKLGLDKIFAVTNQAKFAEMNLWLKKRLSDFEGETIDFEKLEKIKQAAEALRANIPKFYRAGFKALTEDYEFEFHSSLQKASTKTALLDLTFDFNHATAPETWTLWRNAVNGDFRDLLIKEPPQLPDVTINKAILTHGIKRSTHLAVGLPYFKSARDHIQESLASGEIIQTENGKIWVFNLEAADAVKKKNSLGKLSIAVRLAIETGVRKFSEPGFSYSYRFLLAKRQADREYMEEKIRTLAEKYLSSQFSGEDKKNFPTYLSDLDLALNDVGISGTDNFGDVLASFSVSYPETILMAWENAPPDKKNRIYRDVSVRVQEWLRRFVPLCDLDELELYKEIRLTYPLLVYSALPLFNKIDRNGNVVTADAEFYDFDFHNDETRQKVFQIHCRAKLKEMILPRVRAVLSSKPGTQELYRDEKIDEMFRLSSMQSEFAFEMLVSREKAIVEEIVESGVDYAAFRAADNSDRALKKLAEFGTTLSDAFNSNIGGRFGGSKLRPLGSLLFVETALAFKENTNHNAPKAMLELIFLKNNSGFDVSQFLEETRPKRGQIALEQRIVGI